MGHQNTALGQMSLLKPAPKLFVKSLLAHITDQEWAMITFFKTQNRSKLAENIFVKK